MIVNILKEYRVTAEQVNACARYTDEATNEVFYRVESESRPGKEHTVKWLRRNNRLYITCSCEAGEAGLVCWHKRAVCASEREFKALKKAETVEMPAVQHPEVVSRHEAHNGVMFTVACGAKYEFVLKHVNGIYTCDCTDGELNLQEDCKHCKVAARFEEQFRSERAAYIQSL